jgi:hypothetical protein
MSALKVMVDYYLNNNNNRNNDDFEDDMLDFEDELENQDKFTRSILNIENNKQDLIANDNGIIGLLNLVNNDFENNHSIRSYELNNKDQSQSILICRDSEIINTIYLEIELENMTFYELTNFDKLQLFDTEFDLTVGGQTISRSTILTNLFILFSQDINIKLEGNKFQIPLVDFTKANINRYYNDCNGEQKLILREEDLGLPHVALQYHELIMIIQFKTKELFKFMKFNLKVCGKFIDSEPRRALAKFSHEYLFLQSQTDSNDNLDKINLNYNLGAKVIILYFKPLTDDYIDYPKIQSIEVMIDGKTIFIDKSDLLFMELYDICYTVIPLTPEFKSWKNINRTLKNPKKYMSSHILSFENKFVLYINYESRPDNFEVCINAITPNFYRMMSGMGGWAFSN